MAEAEAHLKEALTLDPSDPIYNSHMGSFYLARGMKLKSPPDVDKAVGFFDTAIASDPTYAPAYNGRAATRKIMGRKDEAIADWEKAVQLEPTFDLPIYNLAVAYLEKGDKAKALERCQKYLLIKGIRITDAERRDVQSLIEQCRAK